MSKDLVRGIALSTLLSLAFGAGGVVANFFVVRSAQAKADERLDAHTAAPGHAIALERLGALERQNQDLLGELRAARREITAGNGNLRALCQAIKGAQCLWPTPP